MTVPGQCAKSQVTSFGCIDNEETVVYSVDI